MAAPSESGQLLAGWRALAGGRGQGWRTIEIATRAGVAVRAGRHHPGDHEAVLFGFKREIVPASSFLPTGNGFAVSRVDLDASASSPCWLALSRVGTADTELFAAMAEDVLNALTSLGEVHVETRLKTLLARITAWQDFMERGQLPVLGPEAELGLVGELAFLHRLLDIGMGAAASVEAWKGPIRGLQDFALGAGAVEVKASIASDRFPAKIDSLDQLDDSIVRPIFLAAERFELGDGGKTLPEFVDAISARLGNVHIAAVFEERLMRAGYLHQYADRYGRKFKPTQSRILLVDARFPRLTKGNVPNEIASARYTVDLDRFDARNNELEFVLRTLGAL
jgi:hypothetical protein